MSSAPADKVFDTYFDESVQFLREYKWLFDFQVTELFCDSSAIACLEKLKAEWGQFFQALTIAQLNKLIDNETWRAMPESLQSLIERVKRLVEMSKLKFSDQTAATTQQSTISGVSLKKKHEIEQMMPFIRELCSKNNCKYVIDIGSGLGYFDQFLTKHSSDITVIGVERNVNFHTCSASKQANNDKVLNISYEISSDTSQQELVQMAKEALGEKSTDCCSFGLISLHSCADLTPHMLRIFAANNNDDLKFLVAFSCCYHVMTATETTMSSRKNQHFKHFPMSQALKKVFVDADDFTLGLYGLRLACQQSKSNWTIKNESDLDEHKKQIAYRAIVERYCKDKNYKMKKLKKKLAAKSEFKDFSTYIKFLDERIEFEDLEGNIVSKENFLDDISPYYDKFEPLLDSLVALKALQVIIQPIIERLILNDRVAYLGECSLDAKLVKLFDESLSPRCICILCEK